MRSPVAWMLVIAIGVASFAGGVLASTSDDDPPVAGASWSGYGLDRWPSAGWRPYAADSPFNTPIPANVRVHPDSDRMVRRILTLGDPAPAPIVAGISGTEDDYAHPTYYARRSDPEFVLRPYEPWGQSDVRGKRIHIPAAAQPAPGGDGHMTVVQPDGWEYDFWRVQDRRRSGGTLRFGWGGRVRIDGSGVGGRATAAHFGNLAGIVRAPELAAGRIDHALFVVVGCTTRSLGFGYGARLPSGSENSAYVYPARGGGSTCEDGSRYAPPLGARLQLAMTPDEIDALGLPAWKAGILHAFARYGGYIGDTGGPGFALNWESSLTFTAYGRPDPLVALGRQQLESGDPHVTEYEGRYLFDLADGVDWERYLRVVAPPAR